MKTLSKAVAVASLISAGFVGTQVAHAEVSFNAAITSNYVWRGDTQNADTSAFQGGADYAHESGLSAGIWTSSLAGDTEVDYYAAYTLPAGPVELTVGAIAYDYNDDTADFAEVNFAAAAAGATLSYSQKVSEGEDNDNGGDKDNDSDAYVHLGYGLSLAEDLALDLGFGQVLTDAKDAEGDNAGKYDLSASLTKSLPEFDFSMTLTDKEDGENEFFITASKGF